MALGVWKSGLLEHIREKLLTALLEEVQRLGKLALQWQHVVLLVFT